MDSEKTCYSGISVPSELWNDLHWKEHGIVVEEPHHGWNTTKATFPEGWTYRH
jgi:hypothetical protein